MWIDRYQKNWNNATWLFSSHVALRENSNILVSLKSKTSQTYQMFEILSFYEGS